MASIDRADWHYEGDFPEELPFENAATHIGMYFSWLIENDLIGDAHREHCSEAIENVKERKITGREFFFDYCDGKFWEDDMNEEGAKFTKCYYQDASGSYGAYLDDYLALLGDDYESLYEVPNTWENYDKIAPQITKEFDSWKSKPTKKSWQFWKK